MKLDRFYPIFDHPDWLTRMLARGLKLVQIRIKSLEGDALTQALQESKRLCDDAGAVMVVNDFWQLAIDIGCDWVHLGQEDLDDADSGDPPGRYQARISTHDHDELDRALRLILTMLRWARSINHPEKNEMDEQGLDRVAEWKRLVGPSRLSGLAA